MILCLEGIFNVEMYDVKYKTSDEINLSDVLFEPNPILSEEINLLLMYI